MPTTRPRHFVTETDELSAALDDGQHRWPGLSRPQVLVRLALEGSRAARHAQDERRGRRLGAIHGRSGSLIGVYGPGSLDRLRDAWQA